MTGVLKLDGTIAGAGPLSSPSSEVVCFCYRPKHVKDDFADKAEEEELADTNTNNTNGNGSGYANGVEGGIEGEEQQELTGENNEIEGYLDWSERDVRSLLTGTLGHDGSLRFTIGDVSPLALVTAPNTESTIVGSPESMMWMQVSLSLSLSFKIIFLYIVGNLCNVEWCIRLLALVFF